VTRIVVDGAGAGQRLDRYLASCGTVGTRSQVRHLITAGQVQLDGRVVKAGTVLRAGQQIDVTVPPPELLAGIEAEPIPLTVLCEDAWLLVIDKPAGLVVHPAPGHWRGTLVSALLHHWRATPPGLDPLRPGIVHRIDKDTSGVLVIAKDAVTLAQLSQQFKARTVEKEYVALVWGRLRQRRGTIDRPLGRHPVARQRMAVRAGGRAAVTAYEVVEQYDSVALVRLMPHTGRTHQLRVHLAAIGHPIVGDALYGRARRQEADALMPRQALHAERLGFTHPQSGARLSFRAPLPEDFAAAQRRLRGREVR
jgi:23S rRNA pseudouridine1911/1915/1917 synthase